MTGIYTLLLLFGLNLASADWPQVQKLEQEGKYAEALQAIQSDPALQTDSANSLYNQGILYFKQGRLGTARAYFEKASRLRPGDPDINANLRITQDALEKTLGADKIDPASTWLETTIERVPMEEIRGFLGLFAFVLTLFWIRSYWQCRNLRATLLRPAAIATLIALGITSSLYAAQRISDLSPPAICTDQVIIRSGPGDHFFELARAASGTKLRVTGPRVLQALTTQDSSAATEQPPAAQAAQNHQEEWRQVRYSKTGIGWVRSSSLLLL